MNRRIPLLLAVLLPLASFGADVHSNLGLGLRQLVENYRTDQVQFQQKMSEATVQSDTTTNRVIVNIHIDGKRALNDVRADLENFGLETISVDPTWRSGVISAWLPISQATAAAQLPGVRSVMLAPKPQRRVGSVTAESSAVEHADIVNAAGKFRAQGILGGGISVGIVSDSYNTKSPHASVGIASGDLPGPGNSDYPTQVVVLADTAPGTDEGRGMAEIVHDIAPAAKICFSGVANTQTDMVNSIRNLRTDPSANCDIIADDIYFTDEPFFSDGPIAQAIDDVVTSTLLAGKKVAYFSAAGNEGNSGYSSDIQLVSAAAGKASAAGTLSFTTNFPPPATYAGGFHNFNPGGSTRIWTKVTTDSNGTATVVLQWDDPFDTGTVTTDYDFLVFNANGTYNSSLSSTDDNIGNGEPIEMSNLAPSTPYYLVIGLSSSAPPAATHLRFISVAGASLSGPDITYSATSMFGHPTAVNANAVGAYNYSYNNDTVFPSFNPNHLNPPPGPYRPALEDFSSNGGSLAFYFDANGSRLVNPLIRQKPEFSACDGVNTSFFGVSDSDNNTLRNFFGTSAAAPTAAAIGALVLEAAGGPGSRTPDQVRSLMEQTVFPHDLDPNVCTATATNGVATVQITGNGNQSNDSANSTTFFTLTFSGNPGEKLNQLIIDLTNTLLTFDESVSTGLPLTIVPNPYGISVSHTLSPDGRILTLNFGNTFDPGEAISFGIDRDFNEIHSGGNSADLLAAADIKATVDSTTVLLGAFANVLGAGFTYADGYGLVDARAAVQSILGPLPGSRSVAGNLSTRAVTLTGDNVMIGGFIVQGPASKNLIIRARGPSLTNQGVVGALEDPFLELHEPNGTVIFNDDWQDDPAQATAVQNSGLAPGYAKESALAETLAPGNYTAIVTGTNGTTGVALVEVFDIDSQPPASQLYNISTRSPVQTGDNVMIGGFIIAGSDPTNVVIRGVGPSLSAFGVAGALADPFLELHDGQGNVIATNDNWQQDSLQATQIQAAGLAPSNALESALLTTLSPGGYTAIVVGSQSTTGVGLVEVFNLK